MSSTFGGSGGGSGNKVTYIVTVDSSGVQQGLSSAQQSFNQFNTSTQSTARNLQSFNQPLQQLGGGLSGVSTEVDSLGQSFGDVDGTLTSTSRNMGALGNNFNAVSRNVGDLSGTVGDLDSNFGNMDSSISSTGKNMGALSNNFKSASGGLNEFNTLQGETIGQTESLGSKMTTAGKSFLGLGVGIAATVSSAVGLVRGYQDLQFAHLATERAVRKLSLADEQVVKTSAKVQSLIDQGITSGPAYTQAILDQNQAKQQQAIMSQNVEKNQLAENRAHEDFVLGLAPAIVSVVFTATQAFQQLGDKTGLVSKAASGLSRVIGTAGLSGAFLALAPPLAAVIVGLIIGNHAFQNSQKEIAAYTKALGQSVLQLNGFEEARLHVMALFGDKEAQKTLDLLNKQKLAIQQLFDEMNKIGEPKSVAEWTEMAEKDIVGLIEKVKTKSPELAKELEAAFGSGAKSAAGLKKSADDLGPSIERLSTLTAEQRNTMLGLNDAVGSESDALEDYGTQSDAVATSIDNVNRALAYQEKAFPISAADEYAKGIDETGGIAVETKQHLDDINRALEYQKGNLGTAGSSADEYAQGITELGEKEVKAADDAFTLNAQLVLQESRFDGLMDMYTRLSKAQQAFGDAVKKAGEFINNSLDGVFEKFATPSKKLEKMLKKDLNKTFDVFPKLKADWKFIGKEDEVRQRLQDKLKTVFQRNPVTGDITIRPGALKMKDKDWDQYGKQLLDILNKKIAGGSTELTALRDKIVAAIKDPNSGQAFADLMKDPNFIKLMNPTMEITIAQESLNRLTAAITAAITSMKPVGVPLTPGAAHNTDEAWAMEETKGGFRFHRPPKPRDVVNEDGSGYTWVWSDSKGAWVKSKRGAYDVSDQGLYGTYNPMGPLDYGHLPAPDKQIDPWLRNPSDLQMDNLTSIGDGPNTKPQSKAGFMGVALQNQAISAGSAQGASFDVIVKAFDAMLGKITSGLTALTVQWTSDFNKMTQNAAGVFTMLAQHWSQQVAAMIASNTTFSVASNKTFMQTVQNAAGNFTMLAQFYSQQIVGMLASTKSFSVASNKTFSQTVQNAAGNMNDLASHWSKICQSFMKNASAAGNNIYKNLHAGFQRVANNSDDLAKHWSVVMQSFMKNASSAGNGIYKNLHAGFQKVANNSDDLAKHWSVVMQSFINNAKSAASGVNSALGKIQNITRTITFNKVGLAKGGFISAAGGIMTTQGPTILVGDNPGGRETVAAIPHNNPGPMLNQIDKIFGKSRGGSGSIVNQTIVLQVNGSELINERNLTKRIKLTVGENRDKFG